MKNNSSFRNTFSIVSLITICLLVGCGRYAPVIAPELTAPEPVQFTNFLPDDQGVKLQWLAPVKDLQGRKLEKLDGFKVYRQDVALTRQAREAQRHKYELIAIVADKTVLERAEKERTERSLLKSGRRVKLSQAELTVTFIDRNVSPGHLYLYKVIPFNSLVAEGRVKSFVEVLYNGSKSVSRQIYNEDEAGMLLSKANDPETPPPGEELENTEISNDRGTIDSAIGSSTY
jgi:hypothetical protein